MQRLLSVITMVGLSLLAGCVDKEARSVRTFSMNWPQSADSKTDSSSQEKTAKTERRRQRTCSKGRSTNCRQKEWREETCKNEMNRRVTLKSRRPTLQAIKRR